MWLFEHLKDSLEKPLYMYVFFVPQAVKLDIPVLGELSDSDIKSQLLSKAPAAAQE